MSSQSLAAPVAEPAAIPSSAASSRTWDQILGPYKKPDNRRAWFQLLTTGALFALGWTLMLLSLSGPYWLTLLLAIPTAGLSIRLFIFQHDCGHGSFFSSRRANNWVGSVLGVITFTPYTYWRRTHSIHHATSGNLDRREFGELDTLTVREYLSRSWIKRLGYRLYRSMFVLLLIGPVWQFVLKHRLPLDAPFEWKGEWRGVMLSNLALAGVILVAWQTIGVGSYLMVQLPITIIAGALGIWLFYIQHQFEDTYWEGRERWSFHLAGIEGSSFYDLPAVLHWFTGNIGYHHVHHLSSKIPNYRLADCMRENPELQHVTRMNIRESLRCARLKLWDEDSRKLIGFRELRSLAAERVQVAVVVLVDSEPA